MEPISSDEENLQLSQDSDSNDLPDISFVKAEPSELIEDRPITPVMPCLLSVPDSKPTETVSLASLESLSPLKMNGVAQKLEEGTKLLQKAADLSKDIICKEDIDRKIEAIKQEGGIENMAKRLREFISKSEEDKDDDDEVNGSPLTPADHYPSHPSGCPRVGSSNEAVHFLSVRPPGRVLFTHPASFTEIYPPGVDLVSISVQPLEQLLVQDNQLVLRDSIVSGLLSLCYQDRPCPHAVWVWLFQLMCRSCDVALCKASFKTLKDLMFAGRQHNFSLYCPLVKDIQDVLVDLGADKEALLKPSGSRSSVNDDVFVAAPPPPVSFLHLTYLLRYLNLCVQFSPDSYSLDATHMILLLVKISLDPAVCGSTLDSHLSHCIGVLLDNIPEQWWPQQERQLCTDLGTISLHHQNQLYVAQVISSISGRQEHLVRLFVKHCIGQLTGVDLSLEDVEFVRVVLLHYYPMDSRQHDYSQIFSVLKMLNLYISPSKMKWESPSSRQQFTQLLSGFASRLRDHANFLSLEAEVIRNYLHDVKTELDSQVRYDGLQQQTLPFN